jgi:glucans biosynthesis protein
MAVPVGLRLGSSVDLCRFPLSGQQAASEPNGNPPAKVLDWGMLVIRTCSGCLLAGVLSWQAGQMTGLGRGTASAPPAAPFAFETLRQQAAATATRPYEPPPDNLPDYLKKLSYDTYQMIRFRASSGPWQAGKLPFTLQFFHPGWLYKDPVRIHLIEAGQVKEFLFSPADFEYGTNHFPQPLPTGAHFAGLRILYPVNIPSKQDEVASFVGASYFRLLGKGQRYGASARALAIDTAEPSGEEFPRFTEFWIERPDRHASALNFFAQLDSPSATGAYRFVLKPGKVTVLEVEAYVFLRKDVKKLGLAPLTSMFLVGANRTRYIPDYRPEVHDSDSLLVETATGEWQARPLINPEKTFHVSRFPGDEIKGFGLLQRQREFSDYEDLGARYDLRPDLWVNPSRPWGPGDLELVEIPTPTEFNDNVVAYWIPKQKAVARQNFHVTYSLTASLADPPRPTLLAVHSTRIDPPHASKPPRFFIDFAGRPPVALSPEAAVAADVKASRGEIQNLVVQTNDVTGGWRMFFDLVASGGNPVQLQAVLRFGKRALSETWVYLWIP